MKHQVIFSIFAICISLTFFGCKKNKDTKKTVDATFTVTNIPNGGVRLTVTEYDSWSNYIFNFGDGTSTASLSSFDFNGSITYYYKNNGNYNITLKATSTSASDEKSVLTSIQGVPNQVKVKYVKLNNFPSSNPANSQPWDGDASGPDIQFYYMNNSTFFGEIFNKSPYLNATTSILPLQLNIDTVAFNLTTNNVVFYCADYDAPSTYDDISNVGIDVKESSSHGFTYKAGNSDLYPTKISNSYMEVGLEWIP